MDRRIVGDHVVVVDPGTDWSRATLDHERGEMGLVPLLARQIRPIEREKMVRTVRVDVLGQGDRARVVFATFSNIGGVLQRGGRFGLFLGRHELGRAKQIEHGERRTQRDRGVVHDHERVERGTATRSDLVGDRVGPVGPERTNWTK